MKYRWHIQGQERPAASISHVSHLSLRSWQYTEASVKTIQHCLRASHWARLCIVALSVFIRQKQIRCCPHDGKWASERLVGKATNDSIRNVGIGARSTTSRQGIAYVRTCFVLLRALPSLHWRWLIRNADASHLSLFSRESLLTDTFRVQLSLPLYYVQLALSRI